MDKSIFNLPEIKDKCWMEKRTRVTGVNTAAVLRGLVQCSREKMLGGEEASPQEDSVSTGLLIMFVLGFLLDSGKC